MDDIDFSALAPRHGTRPLLASWSDIGTSQMNGGAFNWGNIWNGLKSLGGTIKNFGSRAWNSNSGQALRKKLENSGVREKIIEGINSGIHGAIDIAKQSIDKAIEQRLEARPVPEGANLLESKDSVIHDEQPKNDKENLKPPPAYETIVPTKRSREEEETLSTTDDLPPPYEKIYNTEPPNYSSLYNRSKGWQGTLNSIVGLGVHSSKKRRCF